jgi:hypothetical protein
MNSLQFGHKSQLPAALATNHLLGCTGDGEQGLSAVPRNPSPHCGGDLGASCHHGKGVTRGIYVSR